MDELSVEKDDVRDIEDHTSDDQELHKRHEGRVQEVGDRNAVRQRPEVLQYLCTTKKPPSCCSAAF